MAKAPRTLEINGQRFTEDEVAQLQALDDYLKFRSGKWEKALKTDRGAAEKKLESLGGASLLETIGTGLMHGASHGMTDDLERAAGGGGKLAKAYEKATGKKVAGGHVRAQASNPAAFAVSQAAGALGTGALLRVAVPAWARGRAGKVREAGRLTGGGMKKGYAERADRIENTLANYGIRSPRTRALALDAAHGAAWGYGGADVREDEEAISTERLMRTAGGAALSAIAAPVAVSGGAAIANLPIAWGGRRMGSKKMLEPPGVTRRTPEGRPRDAIEIARAKDESLARAQDPNGVGIIRRDQARPLESASPNIRKLADQALEPVASERISAMQATQRNDAAGAMMEAYPSPDRPNATARRRRFEAGNGRKYVVEFNRDQDRPGVTGVHFREDADEAGYMPTGDNTPAEAFGVLRGVAKAIDDDIAEGGRPVYELSARTGKQARVYEAMARRRGAPEGYDLELQPRGASGRSNDITLKRRGEKQKGFVAQMMEAVVRQDEPALASWMSTLQGAAAKDPALLPRMRAAVARQLAINERSNPGLNDTPAMGAFLNALGMAGNKAKGTPNVLEAARAPARARNNPTRYREALDRVAADGGPRMRPRHAERMRAEMEGYQPGPYTGPWDPRQGSAMIARGDDQPYWVNPGDFFSRRKHVGDDAVQMAGLVSGPLAYGAEAAIAGPAASAMSSAMYGGREEDAPIEAREVEPGQWETEAEAQPAAPRRPPGPQINPRVGPAASMPDREGPSARLVREMQELLDANGISIGPDGATGELNADTLAAMREFAELFNIPEATDVSKVLARLRATRSQRR